jgi:uncharacterized protein (TIGR02996 family)
MRFDDPSLLAAICNHPEDDALRLVYADWLDDHDEPDRARFVRLQCAHPVELCSCWPLDSNYCHAFSERLAILRVKAPPPPSWQSWPQVLRPGFPEIAEAVLLYTSRVRKWNGVIHRRLRGGPLYGQIDSRDGLVRGWSYRRGFPCTVWAEVEAVARHPAAVFSIGPIERLNLVGETEFDAVTQMLHNLDAYGLRILDFSDARMSPSVLYLLTSNRFACLGRLERLVIHPTHQAAG